MDTLLVTLPAAIQLEAEAIVEILLMLLQPRGEFWWVHSPSIRFLLALPAASVIPAPHLHEMFVTAMRAGLTSATRAILTPSPQLCQLRGPLVTADLAVETAC
jgi:hypothetical protein